MSLSASRIMEVGLGFWPAKVLLSAVEVGLFSALGSRALSGGELVDALGLHPRANPDFFDTLVAMRFLERDGDGPAARYRNAPESATFLDRASPSYMAGFLEMVNARLYPAWGNLTEGLRTGKPQNEIKSTGTSMFDELYREPARLEQFLNAMAGISAPNFAALAEQFDFSRYKTLCDVGGATGQLHIAAAGLADRVTARPLDFFTESFPKADVVTMGMILHDWNLERKMMLIRKAYDALPAGGAFIVVENLIDDARRENVFGLLMSLNMLIELGDAFDFTGADFAGWCRQVGFSRTEAIPLQGPASAGVAYK
jgi:hypothetical protein